LGGQSRRSKEKNDHENTFYVIEYPSTLLRGMFVGPSADSDRPGASSNQSAFDAPSRQGRFDNGKKRAGLLD
jgi:hypothetical protein